MFDIILFLVVFAVYMMLDMIKPSYGVVFDIGSGEYVDTAFIVLIDASTGKEIERVLTDMTGRYYFFVKPGRYRIKVERTHFSPRYTYAPWALLYGAPYQGQIITRKKESVISIPIALHKDAPDWNHENKLKIKRDTADFSVLLRWAGLLVSFSALCTSLWLFIATYSPLYGVLAVMMFVWWGVFLYDHSPVIGLAELHNGGRCDGRIDIHGYADVLVKKVPLTTNGNYWALVPPGKYTVRVYENNCDTGAGPKKLADYANVPVPTGILNKSFLLE